jgi:hypothetical protein
MASWEYYQAGKGELWEQEKAVNKGLSRRWLHKAHWVLDSLSLFPAHSVAQLWSQRRRKDEKSLLFQEPRAYQEKQTDHMLLIKAPTHLQGFNPLGLGNCFLLLFYAHITRLKFPHQFQLPLTPSCIHSLGSFIFSFIPSAYYCQAPAQLQIALEMESMQVTCLKDWKKPKAHLNSLSHFSETTKLSSNA